MVEKEVSINPKLRVTDSQMDLKNWTRRLNGICMANGWSIEFMDHEIKNTQNMKAIAADLLMEAVDGNCGREYIELCSDIRKVS